MMPRLPQRSRTPRKPIYIAIVTIDPRKGDSHANLKNYHLASPERDADEEDVPEGRLSDCARRRLPYHWKKIIKNGARRRSTRKNRVRSTHWAGFYFRLRAWWMTISEAKLAFFASVLHALRAWAPCIQLLWLLSFQDSESSTIMQDSLLLLIILGRHTTIKGLASIRSQSYLERWMRSS